MKDEKTPGSHKIIMKKTNNEDYWNKSFDEILEDQKKGSKKYNEDNIVYVNFNKEPTMPKNENNLCKVCESPILQPNKHWLGLCSPQCAYDLEHKRINPLNENYECGGCGSWFDGEKHKDHCPYC
jgi:hypothetical protein